MNTNRILLCDGWRFALTDDERAVLPDVDDGGFAPVTLPHDWQIAQPRRQDAPGGGAQGFFPREQRGVYRLRFHVPLEWAGKTVRVLFDGVQRFSSVYLNGERIGGRPYGYVPFLCEMSGALRPGGENLLAVEVDNRMGEAWYAAGGDRWYSGAGIYRHVWLLVDEAVRIAHDGVFVTAQPVFRGPSGDVPDVVGIRCDRADVRIAVEVEGACEGRIVHAEVSDRSGCRVWSGDLPAKETVEFAFSLQKPELWSPDAPNLYTVQVSLGDYAHRVRFGVRSAVFDTEEGFLLNCTRTKLWGVNLHHDGGAFGAAVPPEVWARRLKSLKAMGVNTIRMSHNPMAEEFYDLCDEMGFLVVDELYDKWCRSGMYFDRLYDDWHLADADAMVRRDRNHPCVILWSVGNEIGHQYSELFLKCLGDLCARVRKLDPTRALTAALIGFVLPDYNDITPLGQKLEAVRRYAQIVDVISCNYMEHFYEKMREAGIRNPILGSEVRSYYRLCERAMNSVQLSPESPYAIVQKHSWVCGAIIWAGIDYLGESTGWPWRGWTGNPLDSTGDWKLRAWYCASYFRRDPVMKLCVYDESEPWDGARGAWGFPQIRAHWKYSQFEKMMHVAAMTNCDTVKLYQNSQTVRVGHRKDFPDGMVHFYLPYIPGVLRAEGYIGVLKVCEDVLTSDHEAENLRMTVDRTSLPADGRSAAMIDLFIEDRYGRRYMLEDRHVRAAVSGVPVRLLMDNGDASCTDPFERTQARTFNGHLLVIAAAGKKEGSTRIHLEIEGFGGRDVEIEWTSESCSAGRLPPIPFRQGKALQLCINKKPPMPDRASVAYRA